MNWMVNAEEQEQSNSKNKEKGGYWVRGMLISIHQQFTHSKKTITGTMEGKAVKKAFKEDSSAEICKKVVTKRLVWKKKNLRSNLMLTKSVYFS